MKILIVTASYKPAYVYGGPIRSLAALAEGLVGEGIDVTVLTTNANGSTRLDIPLRQPVLVDGVEVYYYPLAPISLGSFDYSPQLAQACEAQVKQFDLVVLQALWSHAAGPIVSACKRYNVPYVISLRGQLMPWSINHKGLKKRLYLALFARRYLDNAAGLQCTVPIEAEAANSFNFRAPTFVVPNGIDLARFENMPERGHMRSTLGIPEDARILLFMGRLHPVKRPDIVVAALIAAQSAPYEVHLIMAGPDETNMSETVITLAKQGDCDDRLHLVGLLNGDEVLQAFADADLMLMPSESENFGMSAIEAMASGVPVLVSDGVPVGHWAEEAGAGRVISCDTTAFAQATRELLSDADQLKRMGQKGKTMVSQRFDNHVVTKKILAQYVSIIETGRLLP